MTISFTSPVFDAAVAQLKSDFAAAPELYQFGQFYVTNQLERSMKGFIRTELESKLRFIFEPGSVDKAMRFLDTSFEPEPAARNSLLAKINLLEQQGDLADIKALFNPDFGAPDRVKKYFQSVWGTKDIGNPFLTFFPKFDEYVAAFKFEKDKCFDVADGFADKLLKARGAKSLAANLQISNGQIAGASLAGPAKEGPGPDVPQQTITYGDAGALTTIMAKMRKVIDAGGVIKCGVLSGARHDNPVFRFPTPEHFVLAFAHGQCAGTDAFLFWDPDANVSIYPNTPWQRGFGVLFATKRLSTALNDGDLTNINLTKFTKTFGDHNDGATFRNVGAPPNTISHPVNRRHCYQAYSLQTRAINPAAAIPLVKKK